MASISRPEDVAELFGVAHEPLAVGDTAQRQHRPRRRAADPDATKEGVPSRAPRGASGEAPADGAEDRDLGPEADPESVARKILLDQLAGRARSRAELAKKLAGKGVPDAIAARLLDRFEEVGLIDDAAFAREWVAQRQSGKGLARRALAQELRRKGIDDELAGAALDAIESDDEVDAARLLVQRKLRSMRGLDEQVAIRRLVGMLARKGYPSSICYRVVREELAVDVALPDD